MSDNEYRKQIDKKLSKEGTSRIPSPNNKHKPHFKLWSREWLEGSVRFTNTAEERGIFVDLLAMANNSINKGTIQLTDDRAYPHSWIASILQLEPDIFEKAIKKFAEQGRIEDTETGIKITNFSLYQRVFSKPGRPHRIFDAKEKSTKKEKNPETEKE